MKKLVEEGLSPMIDEVLELIEAGNTDLIVGTIVRLGKEVESANTEAAIKMALILYIMELREK